MSKNQLNRCRKLFRRLASESAASILPIFGIMLTLMIVIAGAAIDISRTISAREKLSYALDAAGLALATKLSTGVLTDDEIKDILSDSFKANLDGEGFLDEAIENLDYTIDSNAGTVNVTSEATLANYFIGMGGYQIKDIGPDLFSFGTSAQVSYSRFDVELALVVDVTGSMAWSLGSTSTKRIDALKDASDAIIDILLPEDVDADDSKVRISLVPYSQGVNLSSYAETVTNGNTGSRNCASERIGEAQFTDDPYNYTPSDADLVEDTYFGGGSNSCSSASELQPLTNDRDVLLTAIENLNPTGGTASQTGTAWGWYTLSPNWNNLWPSDSQPEPYTNELVLKFAVVMTDGDNNRYYDYDQEVTGWYRSHGSWYYGTYTCEGWCEIEDDDESYDNVSSTRSRELCEAMKDSGITVYGVYVGTDSSSAGARNMESCATDEDSYYMATSSDALILAFSNIAKKIQKIHLSK
ncbi:MAG: Tad domain-containing protein [Roseibium sp.]|uniref:TadE/TadG family type IV pilus assembly protein n=1 Tax=Roseibium sp. TaxID=1936156 RepID=UPI00262D2E9F|nr:pilus assembly protein TadG-related protein [Roseibium sp.]MCV0425501.1 Tad domain-containing protein [Roseibium sp.]